MSAFANRLSKNARHRFKWAKRQGLTAFRLYDLDMPEVPVAVDWYAGFVHVVEYPRRGHLRSGRHHEVRDEVTTACLELLEVPASKLFFKTHEPRGQREQYGVQSRRGVTVEVEENGLTFECNLSDYLDTGLFLDHRNTRARVRQAAAGTRFLNLFAYTGSFTVYARAGGAKETTTVDLSNTYCDWAERNLERNGFGGGGRHRVVRADVLDWLAEADGPYDLVVLDPPSFSTSKKMQRGFDVQRDHRALIEEVLERLAPGGTLYFSTNHAGFELDARLSPAEELTPRSIPEDFRRGVHRCWRFQAEGALTDKR